MRVVVKRRFGSEDDAYARSLETLEDLVSLLEREGCHECMVSYRGTGTPLTVVLPPTPEALRAAREEDDRRVEKRMDLNRMAKGMTPLSAEEWMTEEQLAHYEQTGDIDWRYYGTQADRRYRLD